jgi:hypothetical protein
MTPFIDIAGARWATELFMLELIQVLIKLATRGGDACNAAFERVGRESGDGANARDTAHDIRRDGVPRAINIDDLHVNTPGRARYSGRYHVIRTLRDECARRAMTLMNAASPLVVRSQAARESHCAITYGYAGANRIRRGCSRGDFARPG